MEEETGPCKILFHHTTININTSGFSIYDLFVWGLIICPKMSGHRKCPLPCARFSRISPLLFDGWGANESCCHGQVSATQTHVRLFVLFALVVPEITWFHQRHVFRPPSPPSPPHHHLAASKRQKRLDRRRLGAHHADPPWIARGTVGKEVIKPLGKEVRDARATWHPAMAPIQNPWFSVKRCIVFGGFKKAMSGG